MKQKGKEGENEGWDGEENYETGLGRALEQTELCLVKTEEHTNCAHLYLLKLFLSELCRFSSVLLSSYGMGWGERGRVGAAWLLVLLDRVCVLSTVLAAM